MNVLCFENSPRIDDGLCSFRGVSNNLEADAESWGSSPCQEWSVLDRDPDSVQSIGGLGKPILAVYHVIRTSV